MRLSRHIRPKDMRKPDIQPSERVMATLRLFTRYRILPLNWMHALADDGNYTGYRDLCTRMFYAGLLDRRTLTAAFNNNETQTYSLRSCQHKELRTRTCCGKCYLQTYEDAPDFEMLPNDSQHDAHQILVDLSEAQIELGVRGSAIEYHPWLDIRDHPLTKLPEKNPFRFDIGSSYQIPDGRPFFLKRPDGGSTLFIREVDRNTEALSTIQVKLENYKIIQEEIKRRYGFVSMILLIITTNPKREEKISQKISDVFRGRCAWIPTATMDDHIKLRLTTAPVTTHLVDTTFNRVGCPKYSLKTLGDA